ncbi:MAG: glycosyltransferase family 2 protein [Coriobacteriales bacterium]|jgi:glycosyltransferase involved in cell wall biosynthesis|nr:glycosyltransferase family 2 protein [Coriobacteriales bacterium]
MPVKLNQTLISIVVPIYQTEDYLADCLNSLLKQSYQKLQIICVNDGSTDGSADIIASFAARDKRIVVINKENGGLSSARNAGIKAACGEILMFVDSDDLLEPDACATVANIFAQTNADIITFGATIFPAKDSTPWLEDVLSCRDAVYEQPKCDASPPLINTDILFVEKSRPFVWRNAILAKFLKRTGLNFDESLTFGEDQVFQFLAYVQAKAVAFSASKLYRYRCVRPQSLMSSRHASAQGIVLDHCLISEYVFRGWNKLQLLPKYAPELILWLLDFLLWDIFNLPKTEQAKPLRELGKMLNESMTLLDVKKLQLKTAYRSIITNIMLSAKKDICINIGILTIGRYFFARYGLCGIIKKAIKRYTSG